MAHIRLREEAIKLRLSGHTYGQIKRTLGISKSTLSDWLRELPLNEDQLRILVQNKAISRDLAREKYIQTRKNQRTIRLQHVFQNQSLRLLPLTERELFIAGIFLYWGEGTKQHGLVSIKAISDYYGEKSDNLWYN